MIEQINGTGLSGIVGKGGKGAKNSLFAKLMALFEQHGKGAAKGQSMLFAKIGKQSGQSGKESALMSVSGKQLTHPAIGRKKRDQIQGDEQAVPLFAIHQQSTTALQRLQGRGKVGATVQKNLKVGTTVQKNLIAADVVSKHGAARQGVQANRSELNLTETTGMGAGLSVDSAMNQKSVDWSATASRSASLREGVAMPDQADADLTQASLTASSRAAEARQAAGKGVAGSVGEADQSDSKVMRSDQKFVTTHWTEQVGSKQVGAEQQAATTQAKRPVQSDGQAIAHAGMDGVKAAIAAHGKASHTIHGHQNTPQSQTVGSLPVASSTTVIGAADQGSMNDSGAQFSDRGGQSAAQLSPLGGDLRASGNTQTVQGHFQQALHDKQAPAMTLFDSVKHIAHSAKQGKTQLDIQLEPAHLGKIQVTLQSDAAKQLHVHISAEQSVTRQMLDQQLPALKLALTQQGFDLSGFSMGSHGGEQAFSGSKGHGTGSLSGASAEHANEVPLSEQVEATPLQSGSGRLNIHV